MPKMKTKSSAKKRFKLTGTGKIKRKHAFKSHILTKKETKQNRVMQDADKSFSEAQGNLIKGKARKPSPNENLLK